MKLHKEDIERQRCPECGSWGKIVFKDGDGHYKKSICTKCGTNYTVTPHHPKIGMKLWAG